MWGPELPPIFEFLLNKILDISSISDHEYITLLANYRIINVEKHWDCEKCMALRPDLVQRGGPVLERHKKEIDNRRAGMGCHGGEKKLVTLDRFAFYKCPGNMNDESARGFMQMYMTYREHGNLPYPGTMADQPAKIFDFFSVFSWQDRVERDKSDRRAKVQASMNQRKNGG